MNLKATRGQRRANKPGFYKKPGLFALLVLVFLTGCAPQVTGVASPTKTELVLDAAHTLGQTFTAHHVGLSSIEVFLAPNPAAPNEPNASPITLTLKTRREARDVLATAQLSAAVVQAPAYYRFNVPPQGDSRNTDYFVQIEVQGTTSLHIGSAAGDAYMDGALYQNGQAQEAQLAFRLVYDREGMFVGLLRQMGEWAKVLFATLVVVIVPGLILLSLWRGWHQISWLERLSLSCGIGLAVIPVVLLWQHFTGLKIEYLFSGLIVILVARLVSWAISGVLHARESGTLLANLRSLVGPTHDLLPQLCALAILGIIIVTRFQAIGSLAAPMWGDSVHHTVITQLLIDHNGLFDSWQPYADLSSFTYHFGFHSLAAALHWVTGMPALQATLWAGQVANVMAVFALYALAIKFSGNKNAWAGVMALVVAGLLSPMPMHYVNWGRYTQLVGQVILCAALYLLWWMAETRTGTLGAALLLALSLAGLAVSHYRVLLFGLVFAAVCVGWVLMAYAREKRSGHSPFALKSLALSALACAAVAFILFLPWLVNITGSSLANIFGSFIRTAPKNMTESAAAVNEIGSFTLYQDVTLWALLLVCLGIGLLQKQRAVWCIGVWCALIALITNPHWLGLPGTGIVSNFASLIAIYIPAALVIGIAAGENIHRITSHHFYSSRVITVASLVFIMACGWQGVPKRLDDVQPNAGILVTHPDLRAAAWMRANLPRSAYLLVNMFAAYSGTVSVGTDGGWWLPLLAGVRTTLPPASYVFEQPARPELKDEVARFTALATASNQAQPGWVDSLKAAGITHVFIGQRQGRVNYGGPNLNPQQLLANPNLRVVYHEDRVYIFEVL